MQTENSTFWWNAIQSLLFKQTRNNEKIHTKQLRVNVLLEKHTEIKSLKNYFYTAQIKNFLKEKQTVHYAFL